MRAFRNLIVGLVLTTSFAIASPITIAALGDSLTAGYGLPQQDGFAPQLEAWLRAQGADVVVLNAGVSGDTTAGGLSRVNWTLTPDVDAMIVALGGNDYLRGLDPAVSRKNLSGILAAAQQADVEVLLVGLSAGANYGPDYQQEFSGMYRDLATEYRLLLYPSWFEGLRPEAETQDQMLGFMQADGIHPNAQGVSKIVAAMGPSVLALINGLDATRP